MSGQTSKCIVYHFTENLFKRNTTQEIGLMVDPQIIAHVPHHVSRIKGLAAYKRFLNEIHEAFPNATFTAEDFIAENDRVTVRWRIRGVCRNDKFCPLAGEQATTLNLISIFRLANNRIVEYWQMDTGFSLMPDF